MTSTSVTPLAGLCQSIQEVSRVICSGPGKQEKTLRTEAHHLGQRFDSAREFSIGAATTSPTARSTNAPESLREQRLGLGTFQPQLGVAGAVEEGNARFSRRDLAGDMIVAVACVLAWGLEPDRPLPADDGDEFRARRRQPGMDRRAADHPRQIEIDSAVARRHIWLTTSLARSRA